MQQQPYQNPQLEFGYWGKAILFLDEIAIEAGAFYVMDRGYIDFQRL